MCIRDRCRIRTDGSGREVVRELTDGAWLKLAGAANGRIFIWKRKDVGGELFYILEDGSERSIAAGTGDVYKRQRKSLPD